MSWAIFCSLSRKLERVERCSRVKSLFFAFFIRFPLLFDLNNIDIASSIPIEIIYK